MSSFNHRSGLRVGIRVGISPLLPITLLVTVMCASLAHADAVYRLEERGLIIYQDRAPDSGHDDGHTILNNRGVVLEKVLSREERSAARRRAGEIKLARIRDRALLATFTTEEDLIRTRDDRIGLIDGLIGRLDDRIRILSERLNVVSERIAVQEADVGKDNAAETLYAEYLSTQRNIENAWSLIDAKAAERSETAAKFEADLSRYRELKIARQQ